MVQCVAYADVTIRSKPTQKINSFVHKNVDTVTLDSVRLTIDTVICYNRTQKLFLLKIEDQNINISIDKIKPVCVWSSEEDG